MKIAEALLLRGESQREISEIQARLRASSVLQEGDQPIDSPSEAYSELRTVLERTTQLGIALSRTNSTVTLEGDSLLLVEALAQRDRWKGEIKTLRDILSSITSPISRYSRNEIKNVVNVDMKRLRSQIDSLSKIHRELDLKIQKTNWAEDLQFYTPSSVSSSSENSI